MEFVLARTLISWASIKKAFMSESPPSNEFLSWTDVDGWTVIFVIHQRTEHERDNSISIGDFIKFSRFDILFYQQCISGEACATKCFMTAHELFHVHSFS